MRPKILFKLSILFSIILGIVCEAPSCSGLECTGSDTQLCKPWGAKPDIGLHRRSTGNLLSGQWLWPRHNKSLLWFLTIQNLYSLNISNNLKANFIYLFIWYGNINSLVFLCNMFLWVTWKEGSFGSIIKWMVKNIEW